MSDLLFDDLPTYQLPLPQDELLLLGIVPEPGYEVEIDQGQHAAARRLAGRGLITISRQKMDPVATWPTWFISRVAPPLQSTTLER